MTCRVRGTHGLYVTPPRRPAALHSPRTRTSTLVLLVRSAVPVLLLLLGDQPNGIVDGDPASARGHERSRPCSRRPVVSRR